MDRESIGVTAFWLLYYDMGMGSGIMNGDPERVGARFRL